MRDKMDTGIAVVVPVYRAKAHIEKLVKSVVAAAKYFRRYQLVLVDDGSNDGTFEVIKKLAGEDPNILGIELEKNKGQQTATWLGIKNADTSLDIVATLDDDLKQNPHDIIKLYSEMMKGYDVVYGVDRRDEAKGRLRRIGTRIRENTIARLSGQTGRYPVTSFKLMTRAVADAVLQSHPRNVYLSMEILKNTSSISYVVLETRPSKQSRYTFWKFAKILIALHLNYGWLSRFGRPSKKAVKIETTAQE